MRQANGHCGELPHGHAEDMRGNCQYLCRFRAPSHRAAELVLASPGTHHALTIPQADPTRVLRDPDSLDDHHDYTVPIGVVAELTTKSWYAWRWPRPDEEVSRPRETEHWPLPHRTYDLQDSSKDKWKSLIPDRSYRTTQLDRS